MSETAQHIELRMAKERARAKHHLDLLAEAAENQNENVLYALGGNLYLAVWLDGLYQCKSCRHQYSTSVEYRYSIDCPSRPHGYDPLDRIEAGAKHPEDIFCQSWRPDRDWYYDPCTGQDTRNLVPRHLRP